MKIPSLLRFAPAFLFALLLSPPSQAAFPDRPVQLIVPFPAGGATDLLARQLAQKLQERWSQPVVVVNKAGASTLLGSEFVVQAKPDGYTLLLGASSLVTLPATSPGTMRFDVTKDLAPVTLAVSLPLVVAINPAAPFKTLPEMLRWAQTHPGQLSVGVSPGPGSIAHLSLERMNLQARVSMVAVPYKGSAPAVQAALSNEVPAVIDSVSGTAPFLQSGKLRALAVLTDRRAQGIPSIPTAAEAGESGLSASTWLGVLAPTGTPVEVIETVHAAVVDAISSPALRASLIASGMEPIGSGPADFAKVIRRDLGTWTLLVKQAAIKLN